MICSSGNPSIPTCVSSTVFESVMDTISAPVFIFVIMDDLLISSRKLRTSFVGICAKYPSLY